MNQTESIDIKKYKDVILYFVQNCNNSYLGDTKLNKLLYYLDFVSYRDTGKSVTGDSYVNKQYGPVPATISEVLQELEEEQFLEISKIPLLKNGKHTTEFSLKHPSIELNFTKEEQALLSKICEAFKEWNTAMIVDQTHLEAPWVYSEINGDVDYNLSQDIDII